jgi:hypothetical protein
MSRATGLLVDLYLSMKLERALLMGYLSGVRVFECESPFCEGAQVPRGPTVDNIYGIRVANANYALLLSMPLQSLWHLLLKPSPRPKLNAEKASDFYKKIGPYVPSNYRENRFYKKPADEIEVLTRQVKQTRADSRRERESIMAKTGTDAVGAKPGKRKRQRARKASEDDEDDEGMQAQV